MLNKGFVLSLTLLTIFFYSCTSTPGEMVKTHILNGSFENGKMYWSARNWIPGSTTIITDSEKKHGNFSVVIESLIKPNDVRLIQPLIVEQFTFYTISGWIKTKNVILNEKHRPFGAHFAIEDLLKTEIIAKTEPIAGTTDWQYVTCRFNTGERNFIKIEVCLGTYNGICKGKAWYDDVRIERS